LISHDCVLRAPTIIDMAWLLKRKDHIDDPT
jgi:hypothetical protein